MPTSVSIAMLIKVTRIIRVAIWSCCAQKNLFTSTAVHHPVGNGPKPATVCEYTLVTWPCMGLHQMSVDEECAGMLRKLGCVVYAT